MTTVAAFYARVLGLRRASTKRDARGVRAIWLRAGDTLVMIERRERGEPGVTEGSLEATLFAIEASAHGLLRKRLARTKTKIESTTACSVYFRDPDGRRIGASSYPNRAPAATFAPPTKPRAARPEGRVARGS